MNTKLYLLLAKACVALGMKTEPRSIPISEYVEKLRKDPKRAAALDEARERLGPRKKLPGGGGGDE